MATKQGIARTIRDQHNVYVFHENGKWAMKNRSFDSKYELMKFIKENKKQRKIEKDELLRLNKERLENARVD